MLDLLIAVVAVAQLRVAVYTAIRKKSPKD